MNSKDLYSLVNVISNEINELKLDKQVKSSKNYPTYDVTISIMESFIELIQKLDQDIYEKPALKLTKKCFWCGETKLGTDFIGNICSFCWHNPPN